MDEIARLYTGNVTSEEKLIDSTNGVVLKAILIGNRNEEKATVSINIDGAAFSFDIDPSKTIIIDNPIVCNILKASSNVNVDIHISGIRLGEV